MTIQLTGITEDPNTGNKYIEGIVVNGDPPSDLGDKYELQKVGSVSYMQHRLYHPLCQIWFKSSLYPYANVHDWWSLRQWCKMKHGEGFQAIVYVNDKFEMIEVSSIDDVPQYAYDDFKPVSKGGNGNTRRIEGKLKSLTTYTMKQMSSLIDNTIRAMIQSGVNSDRFQRILEKIDFRA